MNLPHIFSNRQFKWAAIVIAIIALIYLIMNIFIIGGSDFINTFDSSANAILAAIIAFSAASIWRHMGPEKQPRYLWAGLIIGWALWAVAEMIWTVYTILGREVPYPSLADLFWIIGYFPMGFGLLTRIQTLPTKPNRSQNIIIWGSSAATILITSFFIFIPIVQYFDPQRLIESILNFIYPLADLFLVIIIWRLFFTFEKGDYGFGWRLLTVGFIFMTISDLIFTYASWQGLYYPDSKANMLSLLAIDVPYTDSYLLWFLGIYALRILLSESHPIEPGIQPKMVPSYGHILIFTKRDDTVISFSPNFNRLFKIDTIIGKSLADALTISEQDGRAIIEKLRKERRVADLPIKIRNRSGTSQKIRLCGVAVFDPQKVYSGSNLLLRIQVEDGSFDETLSQESKSMARYLLEQSGSNYKAEIGQFLLDYYLAYIKTLFNIAFHEGGAIMSQSLLDALLETSKEHNWQMQFNLQTVLDNANYSLEVLREALPILLKTAEQFVSRITDPDTVETQMQQLGSQFSEAVHRDVERFRKSGSESRFSDTR